MKLKKKHQIQCKHSVYSYMFTTCSLHVHYMFTILSLYVQYMSIIQSLYVHYMFSICRLFSHYMFTICSVYVHYIVTICSIYIHYILSLLLLILKLDLNVILSRKDRKHMLKPIRMYPSGAFKPTVVYKAWFPSSQLRQRQRPILSQNKAISLKDDCSSL